MEIEAKFVLPNREVLARLARIRRLAGFSLARAAQQRYHDQFLDTADRKLLRSGWYLRQRAAPDGRWLTLKGETTREGAVHRRLEWNVRLPEGSDPADLPPGELHDRLAGLLSGEPLVPLVVLDQVRLFRTVTRDGRVVGEMSLDEVRYEGGQAQAADLELEVELGQDGTVEDLQPIVRCLQDEWHLALQPRSKLARALALLAR